MLPFLFTPILFRFNLKHIAFLTYIKNCILKEFYTCIVEIGVGVAQGFQSMFNLLFESKILVAKVTGICTTDVDYKKSRTIFANLSNSLGHIIFSFEIYGNLVANV
jgi:hypothetical protein